MIRPLFCLALTLLSPAGCIASAGLPDDASPLLCPNAGECTPCEDDVGENIVAEDTPVDPIADAIAAALAHAPPGVCVRGSDLDEMDGCTAYITLPVDPLPVDGTGGAGGSP